MTSIDSRAWKSRQLRRLWASALALVLAGFLFALGVGALSMSEGRTSCRLQDGVRITDTHGQTGLLYSINSDPTTTGIAAPLWQLLVRTDVPSMYYKSGTANTAWTQLGTPATADGTYGTGFDGSAVLDGTATVACLGAPTSGSEYTDTARDCYFDTLTVNPGIALHMSGFRLFVRHNLACGSATIDANGIDGHVLGGGVVNNYTTGSMPRPTSGGGGGDADNFGTPGGNTSEGLWENRLALGGSGGQGTGLPGGAVGGNVTGFVNGGGTSTPPFTFGGVTAVPAAVTGMLTGQGAAEPSPYSDGATGGGGGNGGGFVGSGGQGGTGGGWLVVAANTWTGATCLVSARGGNGLAGTGSGSGAFVGAGGGGGGGGGVITFVTTSPTMPPANVNGGSGGLAGGGGSSTNGANGGPGLIIDLSNH